MTGTVQTTNITDAERPKRQRRRAAADPMAYAFTIPDGQAMGLPGRTKIYELFRDGKLKRISVAGRTMIDGDSLRRLLTTAE